MMRKTKNLIIWISIVFFALALGITVYATQRTRLPEIFSYVPAKMDQVMVNRTEKNMKNNTSMLMSIPQAVQQQFQNIKVMIIAQDQTFSGEQVVFMETKSGFSPDEFFKTINPEGETTSTYLRLGDGQYVFGPQTYISSYKKPTEQEALFSQTQFKKYISMIRANDMSIISHNQNILPANSLYESLIDGSEYLLMNITSLPSGKFDFSAYIIFSQQKKLPSAAFKPKFTSLLKESTIGYLEVGKILSGLDISLQQGSGSLESLLFKKISANNFAIVVSKGANMFNLGLTIVADDKTLFDDLKPLVPMLKSSIESLPMLTGNQVTLIEEQGKIGYDITVQGIQKIGLYLEQTKDQTKVTLGNPIIDGKSKRLSGYTKDSLAILYIDMNNLLDIYKQFSNIGVSAGALTGQEALFNEIKDKTLRAEIAIESDAIHIKGSIK